MAVTAPAPAPAPLPAPVPTVFFPDQHEDMLFWCLYVCKNGYEEYRKYQSMTKDKSKNLETEIKRNMMEEMRRSTAALMSRSSKREYRFTKKKLGELFSELMVSKRTSLLCSIAVCKMYDMTVYLVDEQRKLYIVLNMASESPDDDDDDDGGDGGGGGPRSSSGGERRMFAVYRRGKCRYGVDLSGEVDRKVHVWQTEFLEVLVGEKPVRALTDYKKEELVDMARRVWRGHETKKQGDEAPAGGGGGKPKKEEEEDIMQRDLESLRKHEVYEFLWEYMTWGD